MMALLLACAPIDQVQVQLSEDVATVARVTWTGGPARVDFGVDGLDRSTPVLDGEALLLGLPAESVIDPQELPGTLVEGQGQEGFVVTSVLGGVSGPVILDEQGRIVWYRIDDRGLDTYRARLSVDGESLLYNAANVSGEIEEDTEIVRVSMDGSVLERLSIPSLAHDFVELQDGTLIAMTAQTQETEDGPVRVDALVQRSPSGELSTIWTSADCFEVEALDEGFANALDVSEDEQKLRLSFRSWSSIVQIDRASGACDWVLGRTEATLELEESPFLNQHQFELLDDSLLVFDNEGLSGSRSRAVEYAFDPDQGAGDVLWSHEPEPSVYSFVLGDVHRFEDGDTLVTFSAGGQIDRVSPQGEVLWRLNTDIGYALGFHQALEDLYTVELP